MLRALLFAAASSTATASSYFLDDSDGVGPEFQGIGGLSGGGATSVLFPSYSNDLQNDVLQFLFGPTGAALHILKVEIGSSAQSTDGSEATHQQSPSDLDYRRGYEWQLMVDAKKINPSIKLYGLPWGFPQWVSCSPATPMQNCTNDPYTYPNQTAHYIAAWAEGARQEYGLEIDWLGIWNERASDDTYILTLRKTLDQQGFQKTGIIAADEFGWDIAASCIPGSNNTNLAVCDSLFAVGSHYPGTQSSSVAQASGKILMASEDDSTLNNNIGSGCWARILNDNFVNGNMTGTIAWNLLAAYPKGTQWYRASFMNALQPWGGNYWVSPKVWITAHHNQFTQPGYRYLKNSTNAIGAPGTGSGKLALGGSYVTYQSPSDPSVWSLVIEKMSHDHSPCVRPDLPAYDVEPEINAVFELGGNLRAAGLTEVYVWVTQLSFSDDVEQKEFEFLGAIPVVEGRYFTLNISVDTVMTVSPQNIGKKYTPAVPIPEPQQFPTAYSDDFQTCQQSSEAEYFSDQNGSFQCETDPANPKNILMRQKAPLRPITWSGDLRPHSLLGSRDMVDVSFTVDVALDTLQSGAIIGTRGSGTDDTLGFLFAFDAYGNFNVTTSMMVVDWKGLVTPLAQGKLPLSSLPIQPNQWHTFRLDVNDTTANAWVDGLPIFSNLDFSASSGPNGVPRSGFGAIIGTIHYGQYSTFDNVRLYSTYAACPNAQRGIVKEGMPISLVSCWTEVGYLKGSGWNFNPLEPVDSGASLFNINGTFSSRENSSLCLTIVPQQEPADGTILPWPVVLAPCVSSSSPVYLYQVFNQEYSQLYSSTIANPASGRCLDIYQQQADVGTAIDAWPCNPTNQWYWDPQEYGQIMDVGNVVCLGVC